MVTAMSATLPRSTVQLTALSVFRVVGVCFCDHFVFFLYTLDFFLFQPLVGCDFFGLGYFFIPIEVESSIFLDFGNTSAPSFDWFECSIVFRR